MWAQGQTELTKEDGLPGVERGGGGPGKGGGGRAV
jgi:hypothetical protein